MLGPIYKTRSFKITMDTKLRNSKKGMTIRKQNNKKYHDKKY